MKFEVENESMKYKTAIRRRSHPSTREYVVFSVVGASKPTCVRVSFVFEWLYDPEDGFSYKKIHGFTGHKRYTEEDRMWLEDYCINNYPDRHHMSY
jgi:hypothetical protein